ncbi:cytochrome P450 [Streptomyces xylophagus]|uniref:cytochrome P450 n=1 Tax=Streptomyces xylophagus TaxID=285514 RepID=UPI000AC744E0|nr:cytochrome P450 [Streptomyces xylophagus]
MLLVRRNHFLFDFGKTRLEPGDWYLLSPHLIHRDEQVWKQQDVFDPDRFLPGAPHGPADRTCYVRRREHRHRPTDGPLPSVVHPVPPDPRPPEDLTTALRFTSPCAGQDRRLSRKSREIVRDP